MPARAHRREYSMHARLPRGFRDFSCCIWLLPAMSVIFSSLSPCLHPSQPLKNFKLALFITATKAPSCGSNFRWFLFIYYHSRPIQKPSLPPRYILQTAKLKNLQKCKNCGFKVNYYQYLRRHWSPQKNNTGDCSSLNFRKVWQYLCCTLKTISHDIPR